MRGWVTSRRGLNGVAGYFERVRQRIGARISPSQRVGNRGPPSRQKIWEGGSTPPFRLLLTTLHFPDVGWCLSLAPLCCRRCRSRYIFPRLLDKCLAFCLHLRPAGRLGFQITLAYTFHTPLWILNDPPDPTGSHPLIMHFHSTSKRITKIPT